MASKKMKKKQRITAYEDNFVLFNFSLYLKSELNVLVMCLYIENKDNRKILFILLQHFIVIVLIT